MFVFLIAAALMSQSPAPARPDVDVLKAQQPPGVSREVQRRQQVREAKKIKARARARQEAFLQDQQAAYEARMAPIWEEQRRQAIAEAQAQQRANALSAIAGAAQVEAITDRQRLAIQARRAGYPQVGLYQSVPLPP